MSPTKITFVSSNQLLSLSFEHISGLLPLGKLSLDDQKYFYEKRVSVIKPIHFSDEQTTRFIHQYADIIANISMLNDSVLWWSTDLSSKSRFASLIPDQIKQFLQILNAIEKQNHSHLLVVDAEDSIIAAFKYCQKNFNVTINAPGFLYRFLQLKIISELRRVGSVVRNAVWTCRRVYQTRRVLGKKLKYLENNQLNKEAYVIKSFIYNHSFNEKKEYQDIFFSKLPQKVRQIMPVFIWGNILGDFSYCLKKIKECDETCIIPLEWGMQYRQIIFDSLRILFYRIKLPNEQKVFDYDITPILEFERQKTHDKIQPYQLFHYHSLKKLTDVINIDTFVLSYENYPWERLCLRCLKQHSPNTHTLGYQHTVVMPAALGMFPGRDDINVMPKPDRILTVGEATASMLKKYGQWREQEIIPAGAIRFQYLFNLSSFSRQKNKRILLALEGNFDIYRMVNHVMEQLGDSDYEFIIRTHPILPVPMIKHKFTFNVYDNPRIEISQGYSVQEDIERSFVTIYWGSSLGIEALWAGRPVIHYDEGGMLSYDPLFECHHLHWTSYAHERRLKNVLKDIENLSDNDFNLKANQAKEYLQRYFHPINKKTWDYFLFT